MVADMLVHGKSLRIEGGAYVTEGLRRFRCVGCSHEWELPFGGGRPRRVLSAAAAISAVSTVPAVAGEVADGGYAWQECVSGVGRRCDPLLNEYREFSSLLLYLYCISLNFNPSAFHGIH